MIRKTIRSRKVGESVDIKGWRNALSGTPAFLIGNGPSLEGIDLSCLENHFSIGINRAFLKIDPTILLWQDEELYWKHKAEISRLKAIKLCRNTSDPRNLFLHFRLEGSFDLPADPSVLYGFGTSGPLAFQLAYALGCDPIVLLGYDCQYFGGKTDFYGVNASHKPHTLSNCSRGLKWIRKCESGRVLLNCSKNNVFDDCYSLQEVLKRPEITTLSACRNSFVSKLFAVKND